MSIEWAVAAITIIGFIGTAFNVWLTNSIRADVAELKVWALERFIDKADARSMVQTYLSQRNTQSKQNWQPPRQH